jgi:hypothetical protein
LDTPQPRLLWKAGSQRGRIAHRANDLMPGRQQRRYQLAP